MEIKTKEQHILAELEREIKQYNGGSLWLECNIRQSIDLERTVEALEPADQLAEAKAQQISQSQKKE